MGWRVWRKRRLSPLFPLECHPLLTPLSFPKPIERMPDALPGCGRVLEKR